MMFKFVIFSAIVACAFGQAFRPFQRPLARLPAFQPQNIRPVFQIQPIQYQAQGQRQIQVLRQDQDISPDGSYKYAYETENGIAAEEQGQLKQIGQEAGTVAQGQFAYTSPEGEKVQISYVADENGFQPSGSHLPQAPAIPAAILKSLQWNAAHPEEEQTVAFGQQRYNTRFQ